MMKPTTIKSLAAFAALVWGAGLAQADENAPHLRVELNATASLQNACQLSFLVQNGHEADITKAVFEAVLFDQEGRVNRLSLFDFGLLPAGRPRVRQFVVPDLACEQLGQLLINGVETCDSAGLAASACLEGLELHSRTEVEVIG